MTNKTVIGIDFGTNSIGFAIGQTVTGTASNLGAVKAKDGTPDWQQVAKIIEQWQPDLVVVGLPLNMDGTEQPMTQRARKFANRVHGRFGVEITTQDERLSTVDAKAHLFERGGYKKLSKGNIDGQAAVVILESWFEAQYQ